MTDRLQRLRDFLQHDPHNDYLRTDVISECLANNDPEAAMALLDEGLRLAPDSELLRIANAELLVVAGRFEEAERMACQLAEHLAENERLIRVKAVSCYFQQKFEAVLSITQSCLDEEASPFGMTLLHCRALHHLNRLPEAVVLLEKCANIAPQNAEIWGLLALLYYDMGQNVQVLACATQATKLDDKQHDALLAMASFQFDQKQLTKARVSYEKLTALHPESGRAWSGYGLIEWSTLNLAGAQTALEKAVSKTPQCLRSWLILAWVHLLLNRSEEAELSFNKVIEIDQDFAEAHGGLAVAYAARGDSGLAHRAIKKALRLNSACLSSRFAEMLLLQSAGEAEKAQKIISDLMTGTLPGSDMTLKDAVIEHLKLVGGQKHLH